jgi:2-polyprenyl-3-methyl-5-hydroxy-6-metoxy-1,4-benzoquinol methylase
LLYNRRLFAEKHKIELSDLQLNEVNILKNKIKSQEYIYETINCQYCKINNTIMLSKFDRYGIPYRSNLCKICGLVYTSPRFNQNSYIKFYDNQYRIIYSNNYKNNLDDFFKKQIKRGEKIYSFIEDKFHLERTQKILDVGCGMGGVLIPFLNQGHQVKGVDYGSQYIEYGKKLKLNLQKGGIRDVKGKYDIIIYSHVFEHILDLNKEIIEIKKKLNCNGRLYIEVPGILNLKNYRYDLNRYFQNAHTYNFSLTTLNNILRLNGFDLIFGNEKIEAIYSLSNKPPIFKNDFSNILNKLYFYELQRRVWFLSKEGMRVTIIFFLKKINLYKIFKLLYKKSIK